MQKKTKILKQASGKAPENLLERAEFLNHLGVPRAALILYDWALRIAPTDPLAIAGQTTARRLAADQDSARNWKQVVGKPFVTA